MKLTAASLRDFLSLLPHYERLTVAARRDLASIERPSQTCSAADDLRHSLDALIDTGFLLPPSERGRCSVAPSRQNFIRVLRVLREHSVFRTPKQPMFARYMEEHLTAAERDALRSDPAGYSERNWILFRQVTSPDWVEDFLIATNGDWERPYLTPGTPALLSSAEVLRTAQSLIRWLLDHGGHVALRDLAALSRDPELLSSALHAGLRYALLFAALDPGAREAIIGVWPAIAAHVALAAEPPPQMVVPAETLATAFLLEDMTALLIACATEPLRLRANDGQLFAKTVRDLSSALRPLPPWVEQAFDLEAETRLLTTVAYVRTFGLVEQKGFAPSHMAISARGRHWLGLNIGDRLRVLMDGVLDRRQAVAGFQDFEGAQIGVLTPRVHVSTVMKSPPDMHAAVMQPFRSLQGDGFFPIEGIVTFSRTVNPLLAILRQDKNAYFSVGSGYLNHPDTEQLQQLWSDVVRGFLRSRLFPLGGVRLGKGKEGLSIAITPAGRYFLGQTKQWQWAGATDSQVIVQPNFEVTFLGEAPGAEAEIGRFAERRGRQLGALFQITKKSIFAAAAVGMTAENVLEILERVCKREVPSNVRREIHGWFAQCRKVCFESVMLIRCPDRETALRIVGLAKGSAVALNDTVLEYKDPGKQRPWLIKKLKQMGVLVLVEEKAKPAPVHRAKRRWGRW
jgi:hypothetical protein